MWVLLLLDCLFWGVVAPPLAWLIFPLLRLIAVACPPSPTFGIKVHTPWDMLLHGYLSMHSIRMIDADGEDGLFVPNVAEIKGAYLMNHRSWGDFVVDPAQAAATVVARLAAVAVTLLAGATGLLCRKVVMIRRGKTSRQQLMAMCAKHKRYLIYPEGTRRANQANADEPVPLKPGGLKNIYEAGDAAHIVITVGKEDIVNEKHGHMSCSTMLFRARHPPILPADYPSFEAFLAEVQQAWEQTWRRAYQLREEVKAGNALRSDKSLL